MPLTMLGSCRPKDDISYDDEQEDCKKNSFHSEQEKMRICKIIEK